MGYRIYIAHCLNDIGEIYRLGYHRPEQAEAYVDAVKELEESMGEIYQRFMQISGISPDDKM